MSWFLEEIEKLQHQIENLRPRAISELEAKLVEARKLVAEIEREILKFSDSIAAARTVGHTEAAAGITAGHRQVRKKRDDHMPLGADNNPLAVRSQHINAVGENTAAAAIKWNAPYSKLAAFHEKFGHLRLPVQNPEFRRLNEWLREQKTRHTALAPEQIRRLLSLGVSFGVKETVWYRHFFDVCDYVKIHAAFPQGRTPLARWLEYQRGLRNKGKLLLHRVCRLDSLGFVWTRNIFAERLEELKAFRMANGHCNVPWDYPENPALGHYVGKLRSTRASCSSEEIRELEAIGFVWNVPEETWWKHFGELKDYLEQHHTYPTQLTNLRLASWVHSQRKIPLSLERRRQLDGIGFPWNPREELWISRYLELKAYRQQFGHCRVPYDREYQRLWKWMHFQKTYKAKLPPTRRKLLEQLGIDWTIEERSSTDDRMAELEAFYRIHGHCNVSIPENRALSAWLATVRRRKDRLPAAMKQKLERMRIDWSPLTTLWEQRFAEVAAFKKRFGHCRIPARWQGKTVLATWFYTQKRLWNRLGPERQRRLLGLDSSISPERNEMLQEV